MDDLHIKLQREIEAAKILAAQIADISANDPDFIRDTIEGETSIREIIALLAAEEGEDKALISGIDSYKAGLDARKDRLLRRIETRRALIANGLDISQIRKLDTPSGTVSLSKIAPKAIIQEEASIPSAYWIPSAPKLDKKALTDALKSGAEIPGATLSNGGQTVTIRRA